MNVPSSKRDRNSRYHLASNPKPDWIHSVIAKAVLSLALTVVWKLSYAMKDGLLPIGGEKCGLATPYNNSVANIPIGTKGESSIVVRPEDAISFLGVEGARVLGTPFLIGHLAMTARDSIKSLLQEGFDTVGARVDVRHLAATPLGLRGLLRSE